MMADPHTLKAEKTWLITVRVSWSASLSCFAPMVQSLASNPRSRLVTYLLLAVLAKHFVRGISSGYFQR